MPFSIDRVVPWGRSAAEYQAMFGLDESDLSGDILGCGDGPASFNAEMSAQGHAVVSVDPLYAVAAAAIERRVEETFDEVMDQMRRNPDEFVWTHVPSIAELGRRRMAAMRRFIVDYPRGKAEARYVEASLPELPFDDGAFDLALSSHLLFLYSEQFDLGFHIRALDEMLRVAAEVRVFPLLQIGGTPSPHVEGVVDAFVSRDADATVEPVPYEFQRGGNRMLRLRRSRPRGSWPTMTTTRYPEADTQDTLWPEDRIETLLPAGCFDAEPAGERYARLLRADAPGKGSGADSPTIHLWLGCRCAGWAEPPSGEEFHAAVRAVEPSRRQIAILDAWANQAAWTEALQAWAENAYTLRELAAALHRAGLARCRLAATFNRWATHGDEPEP